MRNSYELLGAIFDIGVTANWLGAVSGWTVDATTAGSLRYINGSNATTTSGAVQLVWNGVHNPQLTNTTFYALITTYSAVNFTGALDTGTLALSTSTQIQVALTVNERFDILYGYIDYCTRL
jgi:hypothetical protein